LGSHYSHGLPVGYRNVLELAYLRLHRSKILRMWDIHIDEFFVPLQIFCQKGIGVLRGRRRYIKYIRTLLSRATYMPILEVAIKWTYVHQMGCYNVIDDCRDRFVEGGSSTAAPPRRAIQSLGFELGSTYFC
jgi:hypothetical protein